MVAFIASEKLDAHTLQERFTALVAPYRSALEWYCRSIAGSSWEADDLVQDTWLKAFAMFKREPYRDDMSKAYLFRIASNTWIDRGRKSRFPIDSYDSKEEFIAPQNTDPAEIKDAIETLVAYLPERQRAIVLLVDVFQFTASEVSQMIGMTEGAVKAGLHRARSKLKSLINKAIDGGTGEAGTSATAERRKVDEKLVYAYLEAFEQQNPAAIAMLHNEAANPDLVRSVQGNRRAGQTKQGEAKQSGSPNRTEAIYSHLSMAA
jgi:RNA polymerase sigma factor (sigma-70 family)